MFHVEQLRMCNKVRGGQTNPRRFLSCLLPLILLLFIRANSISDSYSTYLFLLFIYCISIY